VKPLAPVQPSFAGDFYQQRKDSDFLGHFFCCHRGKATVSEWLLIKKSPLHDFKDAARTEEMPYNIGNRFKGERFFSQGALSAFEMKSASIPAL
jgi:hypothetical protein